MDFLKGIYYGLLDFDTYSICFALLILIIILCLTRAMLNMAILCILVAGALIYFGGYAPQDIYYKTQSVIEQTKKSAMKYLEPILESQLKDAEVKQNEDGTYEILAGEVTIKGKKGESNVTVYFKDEKLKIGIDEFGDSINKTLSEINNEDSVPANKEK